MDEVKRRLRQLVGQKVVAAYLDPIARELVEQARVEIPQAPTPSSRPVRRASA